MGGEVKTAADDAREAALACDQIAWSRRDGGQELSIASVALNRAADAIDDLLEALKELTERASFEAGCVNPNVSFWDALEQARAAIAKAEGRSDEPSRANPEAGVG